MTIEAALQDIASKKKEILQKIDDKYMGMKISSEDEAIYDNGVWVFTYSILFRHKTRKKSPEELAKTSGLDICAEDREVYAPYNDKNTSSIKSFIEKLGGEVTSNHSRFQNNQLILHGFRVFLKLK